jgi:hypothetical protein
MRPLRTAVNDYDAGKDENDPAMQTDDFVRSITWLDDDDGHGSKESFHGRQSRQPSLHAPTLFDTTYTQPERDRIDGLDDTSSSFRGGRGRSSLTYNKSCPDFALYVADASLDVTEKGSRTPPVQCISTSGPTALQILEFGQQSLNDSPVANDDLDAFRHGQRRKQGRSSLVYNKSCPDFALYVADASLDVTEKGSHTPPDDFADAVEAQEKRRRLLRDWDWSRFKSSSSASSSSLGKKMKKSIMSTWLKKNGKTTTSSLH